MLRTRNSLHCFNGVKPELDSRHLDGDSETSLLRWSRGFSGSQWSELSVHLSNAPFRFQRAVNPSTIAFLCRSPFLLKGQAEYYLTEWPELRVNEEILRGYDDLADALVDALNQPMPLGADILSAAFNLLATDMADDERVLLFLERIEEAAMAAAYNKSESVDASSKRASETAVDEEVNLVELESPEEIQYTASATAEAVLQDINVLSFEELHLLQTQINAA